jgi:hypothetical protein
MDDDIRTMVAVKHNVIESVQTRTPIVAIDPAVQSRLPFDTVKERLYLGKEFFTKPDTFAFIPLIGFADFRPGLRPNLKHRRVPRA